MHALCALLLCPKAPHRMKPLQRAPSPAAQSPLRVPRPRPAALRSGTLARSQPPQPSASQPFASHPSTPHPSTSQPAAADSPQPSPAARESSPPDAAASRPSTPPSGHLIYTTDERGVYPCPFGFAVNVPLQRSDRLVPVVADNAAALAPLADALSLVRASGGFEAHRLRVPTAEIRFVFDSVPERAKATRRLRLLARDLLALGDDLAAEHGPELDFQPALELRCPEAQALSVHLYIEGTSSAHEALLSRFAERLEPTLRALIESRPRIETPFVLRRRVQARCNVEIDHLLASLPDRAADMARETRAVQRALHWLGAARREPGLAVAQNELVLDNVARVARALDDDGRRSRAEGHCHAARFGAAVPLASFAAAGPRLVGALELPLAIDARRRPSLDAALASGLMRGESIEDVGVLSTCLGLAAQLASVKAAIALALGGAAPLRASVPPPLAAAPTRERRSVPPPLSAVAGTSDLRALAGRAPAAPVARESSAPPTATARAPSHQEEETRVFSPRTASASRSAPVDAARRVHASRPPRALAREEDTVVRDSRTASRLGLAESARRARASRVARALGQEEETVVCDPETASRLRQEQRKAARDARSAPKPAALQAAKPASPPAPKTALEHRSAPPFGKGASPAGDKRKPFPMPANKAPSARAPSARATLRPPVAPSVRPPAAPSARAPAAPPKRAPAPLPVSQATPPPVRRSREISGVRPAIRLPEPPPSSRRGGRR